MPASSPGPPFALGAAGVVVDHGEALVRQGFGELSQAELAYAPQDCDALLNRSSANYGLRNFKSALDDADQAAKLDPDNPEAYTARALASWGMNEYLKTLEDSRRALAINPNNRTAHTISTHLNVFQNFRPEVPRSLKDSKFVFLANIDPELQYNVLKQVTRPKLVACDSMNYWLEHKKKEFEKLLDNLK